MGSVHGGLGPVCRTDYNAEVQMLPLGRLYGLADEWEWDSDRGRTEEELQAEVHERCIEQTQAI